VTAPTTAEPVVAALRPLLEERSAPHPSEWAGVVAGLRAELEAAGSVALAAVGERSEVLPLRLPKARVLGLFRCPRSVLERAVLERAVLERAAGPPDEGGVPLPVLRGAALDRYVAHHVHVGAPADPVADLASMLRGQGEDDLAHAVEALDAQEATDLLVPLARAAAAWGGLPAGWWPRTQVRAGVHVAGGAVLATGVVDVELGGPATGRPGVVVEVKAGRVAHDHLEELTHYALLVTLRDGVPPTAVLRWYAGGAPAVMDVTAEVLAQSAARLGGAGEAWARLLAGEPPREQPGPWCGWCPVADRCTSATAAGDPLADLDGEWDPEPDWVDGRWDQEGDDG
jgi:hypothetical protein